MYRIVIFEDSPRDAERLVQFAERYGAENGVQFVTQVERSAMTIGTEAERADLIFMDIEMPGLTGMEAATLLRTYDQSTPIIFVTNLAQFAVRGYEVDALDFIVKPVTYGAFSMRMAKALRVMRRDEGRALTLTHQGGMTVVRLDEVAFVEAKGHNLVYHLADGSQATTRGTLAQAEGQLGDGFVRISKGVIVGLRHVRGYRGQEVTLVDGTQLAFGRTMRKDAMTRMAEYFGRVWESS